MTNAAPRASRPDEIPIIDLADGNLARVAKDVRKACENSAFFYIANHGVAATVVDGAFAEARRFFSLPIVERIKVEKNRFHRGYLPLGTTHYPGKKKDLKDSFDFGVDLPLDDPDVVAGLPLHGPNQWPDLPGFRETLEAYFAGVQSAGLRTLRALAVSLEVEEDFFTKLYSKPAVTTRVIHYPKPEDATDDDFGIGALTHTDYGHITILAQDPAGGLEIQLPNGEWISAVPVPETFVVNLGDLTARWTNDVFRSNPHRVVNRLGRDRFSIPTFMNPNHRTIVECIPTCTGPGRPPRYEAVLAGEYVANKIRTNQGYKPPQEAPLRAAR